MKLIDVLVMISKGELKEGTKIRWDIYEYIYKDGELVRKECGASYYIFGDMETRHLNVEVELIEPDHFTDVCKMATEKIEELDIDSTTWNDLYIEQKLNILFEKQNEVINKVNAQTTVLLAQEKEIKEIKEQLDY